MYVDESGDTGLSASPTSYFVLSGLVVHESRWRDFLNQLVDFRRRLRTNYGLPIRSEIHAAEFVNRRVRAVGRSLISRPDKLSILQNVLDELARTRFISITNVVVRKSDKIGRTPPYDIFDTAMIYAYFPGRFKDDYGMVITDATAGNKLLRKVRRMAVYNPIPNDPTFGGGYRNLPIVRVIEDPYGKDSSETLPIQMADVAAYFLHQRLKPNSFVQRMNARQYFDRLLPVLNAHASRANQFGVVVL
jgi:hypothetical protein